MAPKQPCVYILASRPRGTLYVGVTSNIRQRIWKHQKGLFKGFTAKHHIHLLVWYEFHNDMEHAILREKSLKRWRRKGKFVLVESFNPDWNDLSESLV